MNVSSALSGQVKGRLVLLVLLALVMASVAPVPSRAALAPARLAPASLGEIVPLEKVTDFAAQPLAILAKFPDAGPAMSSLVAKIFSSQPAAVDAILSIINDTSPQQASAIGAGLVRGLRALGGANTDIAKAVHEKVMRTENPWFKTTFLSIGPSRKNLTLVLPQNVAPAPVRSFHVGDELANGQSRIGPVEKESIVIVEPQSGRKQFASGKLEPLKLEGVHGTIVAILASDAASNGAVSTSPIN